MAYKPKLCCLINAAAWCFKCDGKICGGVWCLYHWGSLVKWDCKDTSKRKFGEYDPKHHLNYERNGE